MALARLPSASTVLVGAVAAALVTADQSSRWASVVKKVLAVLLVLNWRALPFAWHSSFWWTIPELYLRIWRKGEVKAMAIARDPFSVKSVTKGHVSCADADYNMHMSNSSYAKVSDAARFRYLLELIGPAFGEGIWSPLAATSWSFYKEIPIGAPYEIDCHIVSWDEKWVRRNGIKNRLNCVGFSKSCFKLRGSRLSIPPSRVLSFSGVGPDRSNWERTVRLRKEHKARKWLLYGAALSAQKLGKWTNGEMPAGEAGWDEDGLDLYEEKRLERLPVAQRFGETADWVDL